MFGSAVFGMHVRTDRHTRTTDQIQLDNGWKFYLSSPPTVVGDIVVTGSDALEGIS